MDELAHWFFGLPGLGALVDWMGGLPSAVALLLSLAAAIAGLLALYALAGWLYARVFGTRPDKSPHLGVMEAAYDDNMGPRCPNWHCHARPMAPDHDRDGWVCTECGRFMPYETWEPGYRRAEERQDAEAAPVVKAVIGGLALILVLEALSGLL